MPRIPMMPLRRLEGEMMNTVKRLVKERGDIHLGAQMMRYGEGGEEFPPIILDEYGEVMGLEGKTHDESILLLRVMFALDLGMVRVKNLPRLPRRDL